MLAIAILICLISISYGIYKLINDNTSGKQKRRLYRERNKKTARDTGTYLEYNIFAKIYNSSKVFQFANKYLPLIIMLVGIAARVYQFGSNPPGLNQDEASVGYDAYAVLKHGMDRNGIHNPVHLIAWGSGQNALYAYLSMPFIAVMGLNEISTRLVNLLFGCIALPVFYLLVKRIASRPTALMSLFLMAVCPWHIMLSRWALESNLFPAVFLIGVYLLVLGIQNRRFIPVSLFVFALCLYSYGTAYFVIPVFLSLVFIYLLYHKNQDFKTLGIGTAVFAVSAIPILLFLAVNHFKQNSISSFLLSIPRLTGSPRYNAVSSIFSTEFVSNSINNFKGFAKMMASQDDGLIWNSIPEYGILYLFSLPFAFLGLAKLISDNRRLKEFRPGFIMLLWTASALLLSFAASVNINRINILFIPLIYFTAEGIVFSAKHIKSFMIAAVIMYIISFCSFSNYYFTKYAVNSGYAFFESFGDAIKYSSSIQSQRVYVTNTVNMPYIFVLFYEGISPQRFISTVNYANPGGDFQFVNSFDKYTFNTDNVNPAEDAVYIINNSEKSKFDANFFNFKEFKYYTVVTKR